MPKMGTLVFFRYDCKGFRSMHMGDDMILTESDEGRPASERMTGKQH